MHIFIFEAALRFAVFPLRVFAICRIRFIQFSKRASLTAAYGFADSRRLFFNEILMIQNPHIVDFCVAFCRKRILKRFTFVLYNSFILFKGEVYGKTSKTYRQQGAKREVYVR